MRSHDVGVFFLNLPMKTIRNVINVLKLSEM